MSSMMTTSSRPSVSEAFGASSIPPPNCLRVGGGDRVAGEPPGVAVVERDLERGRPCQRGSARSSANAYTGLPRTTRVSLAISVDHRVEAAAGDAGEGPLAGLAEIELAVRPPTRGPRTPPPGLRGIPSTRHRSLPRPPGRIPTTPSVCLSAPATAPISPSPPNATATSPFAAASTASSRACSRLFVYSKRCSNPFARSAAWTSGNARAGTAPAGDGVDDQRRVFRIRLGDHAEPWWACLVRFPAEWRSASISDFSSSPLGGNSAWAAARSRETSTEKTARSRHLGVT